MSTAFENGQPCNTVDFPWGELDPAEPSEAAQGKAAALPVNLKRLATLISILRSRPFERLCGRRYTHVIKILSYHLSPGAHAVKSIAGLARMNGMSPRYYQHLAESVRAELGLPRVRPYRKRTKPFNY
jgi:hypothetical protein